MKTIARKIKKLVLAALGKGLIVKPDIGYTSEKFGSDYGSWNVVTEKINHHSVVYSFGVGEDVSFDLALIEKYGLTVHAFDPTPKSIEWVKRQGLPENFVMHEYGIAAFDGNAHFSPPENPNHVSHTILDRPSTKTKAISVPMKRLETIVGILGHKQIDVLKMDIEGAEYDVISDICASGIRPNQILIEFHHRFQGVGVKKTKVAIEELLSIGYHLFSVSQSNEEFGFILSNK